MSGPTPRFFEKGRGTMSFSSEVKAELCRTALSRRCCAQAEAYGVLLYCNQFTASQVRISTESNAFAARLPALFHRAFQLSFDRTPEEGAAKRIFSITEPDKLSALWSAFGHEPAGGGALPPGLFSGGLSGGRLGDRPGQALPPGAVHPPSECQPGAAGPPAGVWLHPQGDHPQGQLHHLLQAERGH